MPSCVGLLRVLFGGRKGEIYNAEFISIYMALLAITSTQHSQHWQPFTAWIAVGDRVGTWRARRGDYIYYIDPCG